MPVTQTGRTCEICGEHILEGQESWLSMNAENDQHKICGEDALRLGWDGARFEALLRRVKRLEELFLAHIGTKVDD